MTEKFNVTGMSCAACVARVEKAVNGTDGVKAVSVNLLSNSMVVEYDDSTTNSENIISAVENAGYKATIKTDTLNAQKEKTSASPMMTRVILSLILLVILMSIAMGPMIFGYPLPSFISSHPLTKSLIQLIITLPILIINRVYFIKGFSSLIKGSPNMDSLVALGSSASAIYGIITMLRISSALAEQNYGLISHLEHELYFEGAAMIVTLITVGKMLEEKSRIKTGEALAHLIDMSPKTASVERGGEVITLTVDKIAVGDIIRVKAGEVFALDGIVIDGEGEADESAVTGESLPVTKKQGSTVIGATLMKSGFVRFRVTHIGSDTVFAKIIELVDNAQSGKAPIARLADKIAGIFVPVVMAISIITLAVWILVSKDFSTALTHAVAVLVISCPCALGLATPVAITVGTGKGAENGILIKSAEILESMHKVDTVVLDKTGTLTEGKPRVTDIYPIGITREELIRMSSSLEEKSEHPLSLAIKQLADTEGITPDECNEYKTFSGKGVSGIWNGKICLGGNTRLLQENGIDLTPAEELITAVSQEGKTPLCFSADGILTGVIAVADTLKQDSAEAVRLLTKKGIRVIMLTGDNQRTAKGIGQGLGLSEIISDVLPSDKEEVIRGLQAEGKHVAMVGDGINDAPALTRANVGFAIGSGTDIARESSDVVLMKNSLVGVYDALRLSDATIRNIRQNLFWAFFYNCIGIPLAAGAFVGVTGWTLSPIFASAAMSLSSLFVVTNALRLKKFKTTATSEKAFITVKIKGMMCEKCVAHVEEALSGINGFERCKVSLKDGSAKVWGNIDREKIKPAIENAGYKFLKIKD